MTSDNGSPLEDDPGPLVRPFAVTRGRAGKVLVRLLEHLMATAMAPLGYRRY